MILIITLLVLFFSFLFYNRINGGVRFFTITTFFLLCYLAYALTGSVLLNYAHFESEIEDGFYNNPEVLRRLWLYTLIGFVGLIVGIGLSQAFSPPQSRVRYLQEACVETDLSLRPDEVSFGNYLWFLFFSFIAVVVLLMYRSQIGAFPIESITQGAAAYELALLRSQATNAFIGKMYRYEIFMDTIPQFLFIASYMIKQTTTEKKWKYLFYFLFLYNGFYALVSLQKAPIIKLLLLFFIMHVFLRGKMNKKLIVLIISISIPLIVAMYVFFMGAKNSSVDTILGSAIHRIFIGSIAPFYWYIDYFDIHDFLGGTSFPNPGGLLPFTHFQLTVVISNFAHNTGDVVGSMPTVFIGEMYANFGVFGIILSSIFMGFIIQTLDVFFLKKFVYKKPIGLCALYLFLVNFFSKYTGTSASNFIVDINLYVVMFVYLLLLVSDKKLS